MKPSRLKSVVFVATLGALAALSARPAACQEDFPFRRGDVDGSGAVDIGDAVTLVTYLLDKCASATIACPSASEIDGNRQTWDNWWFLFGRLYSCPGVRILIPQPGPFECGEGEPDLGCRSYDCAADGSHPETAEFEPGFLEQSKTERDQLVVDCTAAHAGAGPGARGFSFGVTAGGGTISAVTATGLPSHQAQVLTSFQVTGCAGNEGALCGAVFFTTSGCVDMPTNTQTSVVRLTIDPLPGSQAVTLSTHWPSPAPRRRAASKSSAARTTADHNNSGRSALPRAGGEAPVAGGSRRIPVSGERRCC